MVHTVRVSGPAELLATIPTLIGSQPEQSVVIVITRDGTTGALRAPSVPPFLLFNPA